MQMKSMNQSDRHKSVSQSTPRKSIIDNQSQNPKRKRGMVMLEVECVNGDGIVKSASVSEIHCANDDMDVSFVEPSPPPSRQERAELQKANLLNLLSGIYAILLVIIAFTFEVSVVTHEDASAGRYEAYYIYLYTLSLVFLGFCFCFLLRSKTESRLSFRARVQYRLAELVENYKILRNLEPHVRKLTRTNKSAPVRLPSRLERDLMSLKRKVTHSSPSAGSMYLRLGAIVFGVMGIIHYCLEVGHYIEIKNGKKANCFSGTAVTSLTLSILFVFIQLYFIFLNSQLTIHRFKTVGRFGTMHLVATNLCVWIRSVVIEEFNAAGHLSTDSKNGTANGEVVHRMKRAVSLHLARCLKEPHPEGFNLGPFLITCLIEYSIICAAVMFILWKNVGYRPPKRNKQRRQHFRVDCSSAARGFFLGILFFIAIIVTLLTLFFDSSANHQPPIDDTEQNHKLNVYLTAEIVLFVIIIAATVLTGFFFRKLEASKRTKDPASLLLDDILLIVALVGELIFCMFRLIALLTIESDPKQPALTFLRMSQVLLQTVLIMVGQRLESGATLSAQGKKPGRNLVTFLLIVNVALWVSNMFETQKTKFNENVVQYYNKHSPYAYTSTLPLTIFYRFHSSACLYEIWKNAYKTRSDFL